MIRQDAGLTFILQLLFALIAVVGAAMVFIQTKYAVLPCLIVVFLLPLMSLLLWIFRKKRGITYSGTLRRYIIGFRVAIVTGWCVSLLPGLFWGAIFFHIYEPWPFSLNQGPDTEYSEEGFLKVLGFNLGAEINQVFYKGYEIRDYDRYLRFSTCNKEIEDKVVVNLEKEQSGSPSSHLNSKLSWWFLKDESSAFEHWASDYKEVWLDRQSCTFYIRNWTT